MFLPIDQYFSWPTHDIFMRNKAWKAIFLPFGDVRNQNFLCGAQPWWVPLGGSYLKGARGWGKEARGGKGKVL